MNIIRRLKSGRSKPKRLSMRATAVVVNENREVLLVKHNGQKEWSLPGGHIVPGEDPAHRAVLKVAEETGLRIAHPRHMGRYAGTVAAHEIYLAQSSGEPRPNRRELQDAVRWDGTRPLPVQQHVGAILATVASRTEEL